MFIYCEGIQKRDNVLHTSTTEILDSQGDCIYMEMINVGDEGAKNCLNCLMLLAGYP